MGLIRQGDPYNFPEIDTMIRKDIKFELDSVWRHYWEADKREKQLLKNGVNAYILKRYAPPEEVMSHLPNRGIPEIGEKKIYIDGRYTEVWDVWVAAGHTYREKKINKTKSKRKVSKASKRKSVKCKCK